MATIPIYHEFIHTFCTTVSLTFKKPQKERRETLSLERLPRQIGRPKKNQLLLPTDSQMDFGEWKTLCDLQNDIMSLLIIIISFTASRVRVFVFPPFFLGVYKLSLCLEFDSFTIIPAEKKTFGNCFRCFHNGRNP